MSLPLPVDYRPMEARVAGSIPEGAGWQYEPKWDGFRCLAFRDRRRVELRSKSGRPLGRYFPDVVEAVAAVRSPRFVLDGEIVVPIRGRAAFDALLMRIHPAASRVARLARESPALFILFDLLVDERGRSLTGLPLDERRARLEEFVKRHVPRRGRVRLSPASVDARVAGRWLRGAGTTLDGVIAKRRDLDYRTGERTGMLKIKTRRTADCVVGGFRYASAGKQAIGSLLLGLYDGKGLLHHVGFTSSLDGRQRRALVGTLEPLRQAPGFTGAAPGGPSRWSTRRSDDWVPLAPRLVVEVEYDQLTADRFRHGTRLLRFRPDKSPRQCTFDQIAPPRSTLKFP